ncbi:MAG TPA: hypothetical protein VL652_40585 [Kutzneria sp.]|nr:hypothetical protein [Kutzneria sp.]
MSTLAKLGVPDYTSYRRCQPDGPWRWLLPGILMLSNGQPTARQRLEAALLHGGPDALVTGTAAARQYGLQQVPPDDVIHMLIPHDQHIHSTGFAVVERTIHMPGAVSRNGLRLAPVDRAVLDAARRWRKIDPVRALLIETVQQNGSAPTDLMVELNFGSRRGTALPRRVLYELEVGLRSVAESHGLEVWRKSGLPPVVWNAPLYDTKGAFVAMPDAWFDDVALAWEIDSYDWHFDAKSYARTVARNTRYASAGIAVVQTLPSRLRSEPAAVIAELRAAYEAAQSRPRPPVRAKMITV